MHNKIRIARILLTFLSLSLLIACGSKPNESISEVDAEPEIVAENNAPAESTPIPNPQTSDF